MLECQGVMRRPARLQYNEGGREWWEMKSVRDLDLISYRALKAKVSLLEFSVLPIVGASAEVKDGSQ